MATSLGSPPAVTASRLFGALAILIATVAAVALLYPTPLADVFFAAWVVVAVGLAVLGGVAAWTRRTPLVWVAGLLLAALSIAGMWSIGGLIAPSAILLLVAAVVLQLWGPPPDGRPSSALDPPSVREAARYTLGGTAALLGGSWLVYQGVFVRELFVAGCAQETLDCAISVTRWDAVGLSFLGLVALGFGGWLVWRQAAVGWRLAADHLG